MNQGESSGIMNTRPLENADRHRAISSSSTTRTIGSEHYHATMKKEHPDWNFCPTCNASLAEQVRSNIFSLLLTNPENRFVISASLSTEAGTGILSPFSLDGQSKIPVWAEATHLGSVGLSKERLFEEAILQHILPAFRNGFKLAKYSGPEEDVHLFLQILVKYSQRDISDQMASIEAKLSDQDAVKSLSHELIAANPSNAKSQTGIAPTTLYIPKNTAPPRYSPNDDLNVLTMRSDSKVSSGVLGLDTILGGGLPKNKITFLSGRSGMGKTVFATQFLVEGIKKGETVIFALCGEMPQDVLDEVEGLGLSIYKAIEQRRMFLVVVDKRRVFRIRGLEISNVKDGSALLKTIEKLIRRNNIQRIAIDSLTSLVSDFDNEVARSFTSEFFSRLLELKCTTLVTGEIPSEHRKLSHFGFEEKLSSGLIVLDSTTGATDKYARFLYVPKMKSANHSLRKHVFVIENNVGIKIVGTLQTERKTVAVALRPEAPSKSLQMPPEFASFLKLLNAALIQNTEPVTAEARKPNQNSFFEFGESPKRLNSAYAVKERLTGAKAAEIGPRISANRPRSVQIEKAKLTSAAIENPWSSIIEERKEEDVDESLRADTVTSAEKTPTKRVQDSNSNSEQAETSEKSSPPSSSTNDPMVSSK